MVCGGICRAGLQDRQFCQLHGTRDCLEQGQGPQPSHQQEQVVEDAGRAQGPVVMASWACSIGHQ